MPFRVSVACFILFAAGCSLFGDEDPEIEVRTDRNTYTRADDVTVLLTVSNRADDPIFFICTGQVYLEEISGDQVVNRWMIHGFEECLSPEPIDVDQQEVFELAFDEKSALGNIDDAAFTESVEYRMYVDLFWDLAFNRPVSDDNRRSNKFKIVRNAVE